MIKSPCWKFTKSKFYSYFHFEFISLMSKHLSEIYVAEKGINCTLQMWNWDFIIHLLRITLSKKVIQIFQKQFLKQTFNGYFRTTFINDISFKFYTKYKTVLHRLLSFIMLKILRGTCNFFNLSILFITYLISKTFGN